MSARQTSKKYTSRPSPPYNAQEYCGQRKRGNDGFLYESVPNRAGICQWRPLDAKSANKRSRERSGASSSASSKKKVVGSRKKGRQKTSAKYTGRPSPPYSAADFCNKRKRGNDGAFWRSVRASNGVCRWQRIGSKAESASKRRKMTSKAKSKGKEGALQIDDWLKEAGRRGLFLKWSDVQALRPGDELVLAVAIDQGGSTSKRPQTPSSFFKGRKEIYTHRRIGGNRALGMLGDTDYAAYDGPFYKHGSNAVTGSGADRSMLWSNLAKMPKVYNE